MELLESGEMYLETIYFLKEKMDNVRSIDIANEMNFSKPSVSRAVGILKDNGYIAVSSEGYISLLDKGLEVAKTISERHLVLTKVLISLGVEKDIAEKDACKIEHVISPETFNAIKEHIKQHGM